MLRKISDLSSDHDRFPLFVFSSQASLNHELQVQMETTANAASSENESSSDTRKQLKPSTTLHQSSVVRWLSLSDLLESVKKSSEPLRTLLTQRKEEHRIERINMSTVHALIEFLQPWKYILSEVQKGNSPSLFTVLPCISFSKEDLINREKREKSGKLFCFSLNQARVDTRKPSSFVVSLKAEKRRSIRKAANRSALL